ncbi:MAG: GIY-YIG nuclease family protein [Gammaproteobacteria bacterium]
MTEAVPTRVEAWQVYIVQTAAGLLYTGISTDPVRRLREHESGRKGARSLRGKGPLRIVYVTPAADRSAASILEARIKRLSRAQKLKLIAGEALSSSLLRVAVAD